MSAPAGLLGRPALLLRRPALLLRRPTMRSYSYWVYQYRRTWRGSLMNGVLAPVLYLGAMGVGLGSLVHGGNGIDGVSYLQYAAPGLLVATAMQTAQQESTYPVLGSFKWVSTYHAMVATPLGCDAVLAGHLLWIATRVSMTASLYLVVVAAFGGLASPVGVAAIAAALLVGLAFATPIMAFSATRENDRGFAALYRFGVVPMFLFSGTFFPIAQLPAWIRPVAWITPLWHGVVVSRALCLDRIYLPGLLAHLGYLVGCAVGGFVLARRLYRRRLST
jgi:lipooligosaccharide transport system permease protein